MSDPLYQRSDISVVKLRKGRHRVSEVMKEMLEQGALVTVECMELTLESTEEDHNGDLVKTTTWDFACNSELNEGYCDVCAMDDSEDYGTVEIFRVKTDEDSN